MSTGWLHDPVLLIVYALTSYRLTRLWTLDSLPPLPALRAKVRLKWGRHAWTELMDCPWCAGFWISLGVTLIASSPAEPVFRWVAVPLAFSAVVGLLHAVREG